ncbi:unnamed protein product [Merluccius merluccius]
MYPRIPPPLSGPPPYHHHQQHQQQPWGPGERPYQTPLGHFPRFDRMSHGAQSGAYNGEAGGPFLSHTVQTTQLQERRSLGRLAQVKIPILKIPQPQEVPLSKQMVELFEACQQQASDLRRKEMCRAHLQRDIQSVFPVARLYLTGSSMSGLGCRSSDADLCLVLRGSMQRGPDPIHILSVLQAFFRPLGYLERIQLIRAKVPILRFREKGSGLEFDLNVNSTVGIRNTILLRSYAYADLRVRPIILAVKKWARHHQINDASKGTLSSYTLVLMVLHYLQTLGDPVLPSLQKDYPECFNISMEIDMVPEGPRHIPPYKSQNQSSLGDLLQGFLKYYSSTFRWDNQVISVREAKALPKNKSGEWKNKYICVEEPFERNNVARAVHEQMKFNAIKSKFAASCRILAQSKDLNSLLPVRATINKESSRE